MNDTELAQLPDHNPEPLMEPVLASALAHVRAKLAEGCEPPWVWERLIALRNELEWFERTGSGTTMEVPDPQDPNVPKWRRLRVVSGGPL